MWNDERVQALKGYWRDGLSASQIAKRLGNFEHTADNGRSAVIGKAHRLGLAKKNASTTPGHIARKMAKSAKPKPNSVSGKPKSVKPPKSPIIAYEPIPAAQDVARVPSLLDLEAHHCRWPVDHAGGRGYCGCEKVDGRSYCPGHVARSIDRRPPIVGPRGYTHPSVRAFG